jgi:hypothetical protein
MQQTEIAPHTKEILSQIDHPKPTDDRATVVVMGTYQAATGEVTYIKHAFDYLRQGDVLPVQTQPRVNPGPPKPIYIGDLDPANTLLVLTHNKVKLHGKEQADLLAKAQAANIIIITNADGVELARIRPERSIICEFPGPVFAHSTSSTALLQVTAFPA